MPRRIVVDDTDDAIKYGVTGWFAADAGKLNSQGNYGPVYRGTSHSTTTDGSSLTFDFDGTSVGVSGTIAVKKLADGSFDPTWTCTVDGIAIPNPNPTFPYFENNWGLCSQDNIAPGKHTLALTVHTKGTPFYLDNISYLPSGAAQDIDGAVIQYPNTDPSVSFGTGWQGWGAQNVTQTKGAQVALNFRGTEVSLLAYVPTELAHGASTASYSIDNGPANTFRLDGLAADSKTTVYNVVILSVTGLSAAQHNLVVSYQGDKTLTPLPVGAFFVKNSVAPVPSNDPGTGTGGGTGTGSGTGTSAGSSGSPSGSKSASSGSASGSPSGSGSSAGSAGSGGSSNGSSSGTNGVSSPASTADLSSGGATTTTVKSSPIGAIAGGTAAGVAILVIVGLLALFWCRKRRRHQVRAKDGTQPEPFMSQTAGTYGGTTTPSVAIAPSRQYQLYQQSQTGGSGYFPSGDAEHGSVGTDPNPFNTPVSSPSPYTGGAYGYNGAAAASETNSTRSQPRAYPDATSNTSASPTHNHQHEDSDLAYAGTHSPGHSSHPSLSLSAVSAPSASGSSNAGGPGLGLGQAAPLPGKLEPMRRPVVVQQHQDSGIRLPRHQQRASELEPEIVELPPGYAP